jgi:glutamate-ammonia-ligase adenylyltransferase
MAAIAAAIPFADVLHARAGLQRVAERVPASVMAALGPLLAESADPDLALTLFERLIEGPNCSEVVRLFERNSFLIHYVVAIFSVSKWLGETLLANPDLLNVFARDRALDRMRSVEDLHEGFARFRSRSFDTELPLILARFKRREYVRILLRDVLGVATLAETTAEISALSDVLIAEALAICESNLKTRFGTPQYIDDEGRLVPAEFAVLSLGKLGGCELNYSSDIDLLFLYSDGPDAGTTTITAHEFFTRLAQELTDVLSRVTKEGPVFRIDLRLRPRGHEGEPTVSVGNAIGYYSHIAEDWELQALIKARHSAGALSLSRAFLKGVQPFVYRPEINFAAIKTALVSLQKIHRKTLRGVVGRHTPRTIDVKIDRGGIRDIEFLVQCLQRVYGGSEPWLRSGGTLFSLSKLHDKEHLSGKDCNRLAQVYTFLRKLEHRLQLRHGRQTHKLPNSSRELAALCRAMVAEEGRVDSEALIASVRRSMKSVSAIYDRVVLQQQTAEEQVSRKPATAPTELWMLRSSSPTASRLMTDCPSLLALAETAELGSATRKNLHRFLAAASTSGERYQCLLRNADAVAAAMPLFEHSTFLTDILARHPEQVAEVTSCTKESPRMPRTAVELAADGGGNIDDARRVLRAEFRRRLVATTSSSILCGTPIWQTLADHSRTADELIRAALKMAPRPESLSVWAVGRLGSREFDVLSDADLLFVRDEDCDPVVASRTAESVMETLSAYTREGTIMAVDTRLRPHGRSGDLVTTPSQLLSYFGADAQAWEALIYTKARAIAGVQAMNVELAIAVLHERFRQRSSFAADLREMRTRLDESDSASNFKAGAGGVYDLDFLTGYLGIMQGASLAGLNIKDRLTRIENGGRIAPESAALLREAAELYRATEHAVRLVEGRARKWLPTNAASLRSVEHITGAILRLDLAGRLEHEVRTAMVRVRDTYLAVFRD